MFGIEQFNAVINPPEAAILAVGAIMKEPAEHEGQIVLRDRMKLTLSVDHRALDGAMGARYLQSLKAYSKNRCYCWSDQLPQPSADRCWWRATCHTLAWSCTCAVGGVMQHLFDEQPVAQELVECRPLRTLHTPQNAKQALFCLSRGYLPHA